MTAKFIFGLYLTLGLFLVSGQAKAQFAYPENIHYSYSLGILYNAELSQEKIWQYAAYILERNYSKDVRIAQIGENCCGNLKTTMHYATQIFELDYLEISVEELKKNGRLNYIANNEYAGPNSPLYFIKDGKPFIRWFVHPLRQDKAKILKSFHKNRFLRGRFQAQFTESRSMIVHDTTQGGTWSIKTSLPEGFFAKQNKSLAYKDALQHIKLSQILLRLEKMGLIPPRSYQVEVDAIGLELGSLNEAQSARSIQELSKNTILVSGSAVISKGLEFFRPEMTHHDGVRKMTGMVSDLATKNGKIAGQTGLIQDSNHPQNYFLLINQLTGEMEFMNRDPDFILNLNNRKAVDYYPLFQRNEIVPSAEIDFTTRAATHQGQESYSGEDHKDFRGHYFGAYATAYLSVNGVRRSISYYPPSFELVTADLDSLIIGWAKKTLVDFTIVNHSTLKKVEDYEYLEKLTKQGHGGLTNILTAKNLSEPEIFALVYALRQHIAIDAPQFWESYLQAVTKNLESPKLALSNQATNAAKNLEALKRFMGDSEGIVEHLKNFMKNGPPSEMVLQCLKLFD